MNLEWNVFYYNFNKNKIEIFNIFSHRRFADDVRKSLEKNNDKDEFAKQLKSYLFYYFCSKYEYEVIVTSFPIYITVDELDRLNCERQMYKDKYDTDYCARTSINPDVGIKIDVYIQVMNNWNVFLDYVWNSKNN